MRVLTVGSGWFLVLCSGLTACHSHHITRHKSAITHLQLFFLRLNVSLYPCAPFYCVAASVIYLHCVILASLPPKVNHIHLTPGVGAHLVLSLEG